MNYFNATSSGKQLGNGTKRDLADWLELYVNVLFPDNSIDYWSDADRFTEEVTLVPNTDTHHHNLRFFACYVRKGNSEGYRIEVLAMLQNGTHLELVAAKSFGSADVCWNIAAAISDAMESAYFYHNVPEIVEMAKLLPRSWSSSRETILTEPVDVVVTASTIKVRIPGAPEWKRDFTDKGDNAKFYVESYLKDWNTVLTNMSAKYNLITAPGLPAGFYSLGPR
jgi:hypothetical protein